MPAGAALERRRLVAIAVVAATWAGLPVIASGNDTDGDPRSGSAIAAAPEAPATLSRPKVCLVLSGGGARGAAHVGVLKVLEELRVPIDCIAGTSMGALVGATYASGSTLAEMETLIGGLSTEVLFDESLPRPERDIRHKQDDYTNLLGAEFGLRDGGLRGAKGLVSGIRIETVLRRLARVHGVSRFDDLPIPFRAVATDLTTGLPVVFAEGELAGVMRASMSVPGAVAPAEIDGKLLVDGGLTDNLPVGVARRMGADIVIAVNLGTPLMKRDELGSLFGVTGQMINILTEQNVRASLASLKPTDILIEPRLGDYSAGDFTGMPKTIPIGVEAARRVADKLSTLSMAPEAYAAWRDRRRITDPQDLRPVAAIRVDGLERVNPAYVEQLIETRAGQPIDPKVLDRDLQRIYGSGDFERVGYEIVEADGQRTLSVRPIEKAWGPDYLRFGLGLNSDFRGNSYYNLLARYRRTWINRLGGEWRTDLQIGRLDRFSTELYQPLTVGRGLFVAPILQFEQRPLDLFVGRDRLARFLADYWVAGIDLGGEIGKHGELRGGLRFGRARLELETGPLQLRAVDASGRIGTAQASLIVDRADSVSFPRDGHALQATLVASRRSLGADSSYTRWDINAMAVRSFGDHTFNAAVRVGRPTGGRSVAASDLIQWGGFLQQSGFPTGALLGESIEFARLMYYNKLVRQTLLEGLYAGVSLEVGRIGNPLVPTQTDNWLRSGAVFFGLDSPLGPLYLAYGRATGGTSSWYLFLGKP